MQSKTKNILRGLAATACLVLYVFCHTLYEKTFIVWWLPPVIAAIAALLTTPLTAKYWTKFTGSENRMLNILCHIYFSGALFLFVFLGGNLYAANPASAYEQTFTVSEKQCTEHASYRRSGHRKIRTGTYKVYHLRLKSSDGPEKRISVTSALYNRVHKNGTLTFPLYMGGFGYPVFAK
ncbi:hypothetical protein [Alistipes sp.]|uniref:hypothetical protein n=1 Tax=Alistipes sp. TaxID=1872444 RepID=UPI0025BD5080|nr:hypothetical protein [Alistipes sp.]